MTNTPVQLKTRRSPGAILGEAGYSKAAGAAIVIAVLLFLALRWLGATPAMSLLGDDDVRAGQTLDVSALRIIEQHDLRLDPASGVLRASGPSPYISFQPLDPVRSIRIDMRALGTVPDGGFYIYYVPASEPGGQFSELWKVRGAVSADVRGWTMEWVLPVPARLWRLDVPPGSELQVDRVDLSGNARFWQFGPRGVLGGVLGVGAIVALILIGAQWLLGRLVPSPRVIKLVLAIGLAVSTTIVVFLLPPFQGPDENAHWKLALMMYRRHIAQEPSAYYLPEVFDSSAIAFRPGTKFSAGDFRGGLEMPPDKLVELPVSHGELLEQYPYVRAISYPFMFLPALVFPAINTLEQATVFFYLCRILAAVIMLALLYAFGRKYSLSYTGLFFFSLPLFLQQSAVISPDTFLNAGALLAVLLFMRLREQASAPLTAALWILCLMMIWSKFIVAGVLLLPLMLIPARRLPRPSFLIGLAILLSIPALYFASDVVLSSVRDVGRAVQRPAEVEQQIQLVGSPEGFLTFLRAMKNYFVRSATFEGWSGPLGWLDTLLSRQHLALIAASGVLALVLDVWIYGASVVRVVRTKPSAVLAPVSVAVAALAFAAFTNSLLFYLMVTPVGLDTILGMQIRHFFPAAILAVCLPAAVVAREAALAGEPPRSGMLADTIAVAFLPLLFATRSIQLAIDLLTRYFS